jgi:hypothetical protein
VEVSRGCFDWPLAQTPSYNWSAKSLGSSNLKSLSLEVSGLKLVLSKFEAVAGQLVISRQIAMPPMKLKHMFHLLLVKDRAHDLFDRAEDLVVMAQQRLVITSQCSNLGSDDEAGYGRPIEKDGEDDRFQNLKSMEFQWWEEVEPEPEL